MTRLAIVVEGQTEEEFTKRVLAAPLGGIGIIAHPICMHGDVTVERLASEMSRLVRSYDLVTSLVDFYGFRGKGHDTPEQLQERIDAAVRDKILRNFDHSRIFSYVQRYEFEGLLFSDVTAFGNLINLPDRAVPELRRVRSQFHSPEDINDSPNTAPSKRILNVIPRYQKVVDGPTLAEDIGLNAIRAECSRFNSWLSRLEILGNPPASD